MYTLDEINTILSDLDACGRADCSACTRSLWGRVGSRASCFALDSDAASVIRWLLSEFQRYGAKQTQLGEEV